MTAFLAERRRVAAERSAVLPVPTIRDEHWRYTNLRGIDFAAYAPATSPVVLEAARCRPACCSWTSSARRPSTRS